MTMFTWIHDSSTGKTIALATDDGGKNFREPTGEEMVFMGDACRQTEKRLACCPLDQDGDYTGAFCPDGCGHTGTTESA